MDTLYILTSKYEREDLSTSEWDCGWFYTKEAAQAVIDEIKHSDECWEHNSTIMREIERKANEKFPLILPYCGAGKTFIPNLPSKEEQARMEPSILAQLKKAYTDAVEIRQKKNEKERAILDENKKQISEFVAEEKSRREGEFKECKYGHLVGTDDLFIREVKMNTHRIEIYTRSF